MITFLQRFNICKRLPRLLYVTADSIYNIPSLPREEKKSLKTPGIHIYI
jgi:hypothetical protein